jgi:hypothetical protein
MDAKEFLIYELRAGVIQSPEEKLQSFEQIQLNLEDIAHEFSDHYQATLDYNYKDESGDYYKINHEQVNIWHDYDQETGLYIERRVSVLDMLSILS